jgi:hypothetical protein
MAEDPQSVRNDIQALIAKHEQRKQHDRDYLTHIIGDAKNILDTHVPEGDTCKGCGKRWPCGFIETARSPGFYLD